MSSGSMTVNVRVWRQPSPDKPGKLVDYKVQNVVPDMSFVEMLDVLNEQLVMAGEDTVSFDSDCREGICGSCSCTINGIAHGPGSGKTTCQLFMRVFRDGETITVEPFRAKSFPAEPSGGAAAAVSALAAPDTGATNAARIVARHVEERTGPQLDEAAVVVSGGRGLGAAEHFKLAEELAEVLGGAVASTRAVVDAGWYPYATQVGQTGKTITPKLYIGLGISGAIQHKVGMQGAGTIVSINKDAHAPIFDYSDLGVVGDLHSVVPKLVELLRARG